MQWETLGELNNQEMDNKAKVKLKREENRGKRDEREGRNIQGQKTQNLIKLATT